MHSTLQNNQLKFAAQEIIWSEKLAPQAQTSATQTEVGPKYDTATVAWADETHTCIMRYFCAQLTQRALAVDHLTGPTVEAE